MLPIAFALAGALSSCGDDDGDSKRIRGRAAALRYLPLPMGTAEPGPPGVHVNSLVKALMVFTTPSGAVLSIDGKSLGTTPCEVRAEDLLAPADGDGKEAFRLVATIDGVQRPVARYLLRFEAANINAGVAPESIPNEISNSDRWLYLVLGEAPR